MSNDTDDVTTRLLDAFVYVPLGLALEAKDMLPKLAERGRGQVALTRLAGTVAARRGQSEAVKLVDDLRSGVEAFFAPGSAAVDRYADDNPSDDHLPIAEYADLTAVEVIPLLAELDDDQLDAIEVFEKANRNRTTVLNRIRQRRS
ncbi:MAG: hypothetical protein AAF081_15975 [Actinomycetota bacterium]